MAVTTFTGSIASGYTTDLLWYDEGPLLVFTGHYSSPTADSCIIDTGMYVVREYNVQDADPTTYKQTANANGTIAVYFSGLTVGATGWFEFKGN